MAQIVIDSNSNLIQGDFDSATVNNRTKFQTSTVNANTGVYAVPNGTGTSAGYQATNNSNPTNASKIVMATNGSTDTQIISGVNGSGTYLPLSFYTNNTLGMQLSTAGNLTVTGSISAASGLGGMTLLGTITPTAANSISLGSLSLSGYKQLCLVYKSLTANVTGSFGYISSDNTTSAARALYLYTSPASSGITWIDLGTGAFSGGIGYDSGDGTNAGIGLSNVSTSTTTLYFRLASTNTFTATGSIKVYGVV